MSSQLIRLRGELQRAEQAVSVEQLRHQICNMPVRAAAAGESLLTETVQLGGESVLQANRKLARMEARCAATQLCLCCESCEQVRAASK